MGNKSSTTPSFPVEGVAATTDRILNIFTTIFEKAVGVTLVGGEIKEKQAKEDRGADDGDGSEWLSPPQPEMPLLTGWMWKLGEKSNSWKRRFFVASNAKDNFCLIYYASEDVSSREKGRVMMSGMSCKPLKDGPIRDWGPHVLKLEAVDVPRKWYLRLENDSQVAEWRSVLKFCAHHAVAPLSDDPVLRKAFVSAIRRTRQAIGFRGFYRIDRNEEAQLSLLIIQACVFQFDVPSTLSTTPLSDDKEDSRREEFLQQLSAQVHAETSVRWKLILGRTLARVPKLMATLPSKLTFLRSKMKRLAKSMREVLTKDVHEVVDAVKPVLFPKALQIIQTSVFDAHRAAILVFWNEMNSILRNGLTEPDLIAFYRSIRMQGGVLASAFEKIRWLTRGKDILDDTEASEKSDLLMELQFSIPELVDALMGMSLWEVEVIVETSLTSVIGSALFTYLTRHETRGEMSEIELLLEVTERLISESKLSIVRDLHKIFRKVVCPVVKAELLAWSDTAKVYIEESCVSKVQLVAKRSSAYVGDTIGAMTATSPAGGAKAEFSDDFIDNDWLMDEVIERDVVTALIPIIQSSCDSQLAAMDDLMKLFSGAARKPKG